MGANDYEYGKEFDSREKLIKYLSAIEKLKDAEIIKVYENGDNWILMFNRYE